MDDFNIMVIMSREKRKLAIMCTVLMAVIIVCSIGNMPLSSIEKEETLNITNSPCVRTD